MRRPPIACCRAVPSPRSTALDHVWVPEDLLSQAVTRFFRTTCPQQRRHGSHVPGPLEARRRAAKRRMALQSNVDLSGGMPPPLFSFGALFGARQPPEPNWKYQPPSLKREEPLDFSFDFPSSIPPARPPSATTDPTSEPVVTTSHSSFPFHAEDETHAELSSEHVDREKLATQIHGKLSDTAVTEKAVHDSPTEEEFTAQSTKGELDAKLTAQQSHGEAVNPSSEQEKGITTANDQVFEFVSQHHATAEGGAVSVKNGSLQNKEPAAASTVEQAQSSQVVNLREQWARDGVKSHTHLFESFLEEYNAAQITNPSSSDVEVCFEKFRMVIDSTSPNMLEERDQKATATRETGTKLTAKNRLGPSTFLTNAYLICCPSNDDAGTFCFLVTQHLLRSQWGAEHTLGLLGQPAVRLPNMSDPDGLRFLEVMEETYLVPSMPRSPALHLIYKKLAMQIQSKPAAYRSTQRADRTLLMSGSLLDSDASLRLLIRGLWDSANWSKRGQQSLSHQFERLRLEHNRGDSTSQSAAMLLERASYRLSDHRLAQRLRKTWSLLSTDYHQAPLQFSQLIATCVHSPAEIAHALDFLDLVPQSLLRTWIASKLVTLEEAQTVPQLGQKDLSFIHVFFKLLYRLDIRRNATAGQASLCQFAFSGFMRAHFVHRYPPSTLITGSLYGLLGHGSFAGNPSVILFEWIESYISFLAQEDQKGVALNGMLAKLMSDLADKSLPNHGVLELIVPYIDEYKSFHSVSNLLERLPRSGTKLSDPTFLDGYAQQILEQVSKETDATRLGYNMNAFRRLLDAQRALGAMTVEPTVRLEELQSRRFFNHILSRANDAHVVPLAYRNLTSDIPKEVQADLIHQFAHQYSMDRTRSVQQNWRSIRYMYLYLKIHELPMQPMFTRILVNVCITRPLTENKFVVQKKAIWVCQLVAKVEGDEMARQVERHFWDLRGELILKAKRRLVAMGIYDRAHVSTMERLGLLSDTPQVGRGQQYEDLDT